MPRASQLPALEDPTSNDQVIVRSAADGQYYLATREDFVGQEQPGWTGAGETWTFLNWNATTRIAVLLVSDGAPDKYPVGSRVKFTQNSGGVKYGIVHAVTTNNLHVFLRSGQSLVQATITDPYYSGEYAPQGFDPRANNWTVETVEAIQYIQTNPVANQWYSPGSTKLDLGVGAWRINAYLPFNFSATATGGADAQVGLSTAANSAPVQGLFRRVLVYQLAGAATVLPIVFQRSLTLSSTASLFASAFNRSNCSSVGFDSDDQNLIIQAVSEYV